MMSDTSIPPQRRLIDRKGLGEKNLGYSNVHLARLIKDEGFPAPQYITPRNRVWYEDEIDSWIASRLRGRNRSA